MKHFFENIQGWFIFLHLYLKDISRFDNVHFVEIGTRKGRSAVFMTVEIVNSNKNIKFVK